MKIKYIALGKSGASIASSFSNSSFENTIYINTHKDEMDPLPGEYFAFPGKEDQVKLVIDGSGTGRSPKTGSAMAVKYRESIVQFLEYHLDSYRGLTLIVYGSGGGSGSGIAPVIVDILQDLKTVYGIITTLPLESEGVPTIPNSINSLDEIQRSVKGQKVAPFFLVDNESLYTQTDDDDDQHGFWHGINRLIGNVFLLPELIGNHTVDASTFNTVDPREYLRILRSTKSNNIGFNDIKSFPIDKDYPLDAYKEGMQQPNGSLCPGYDYLSAESIMAVLEVPPEWDKGIIKDLTATLFDRISKQFKGKEMLKAVIPSTECRLNMLFSGMHPPMRVKKLSDAATKLLEKGSEKREQKAKISNIKKFKDDFEDIDLI